MMDCIQPVLTKCGAADDVDLEKTKAELVKQIIEEFKSSAEPGSAQQATLAEGNPELCVDHLKQFFVDFINKLEIFDPMDRAIPKNKNQAVKRDDLLTKLGGLSPVPGGGVYAPFSPKQLQKFNAMFDQDYKLCENKAQQLIQEAEEMGEQFTFNLQYERVFESLERTLRYFAEKQLLIDGERRLHKFYIYLKNTERMIELSQLYGGLSKDGQDILRDMQLVNKFKNEKNYTELVSSMISLKDKIESFYADRELTKDGEAAGPTEEDRNDIIAKQAVITSEETV